MTSTAQRTPRPRPAGMLAAALLLAAGSLFAGWSGLGDRVLSSAPGGGATTPTPAPGGSLDTPAGLPIPGAGAADLPAAGSLTQLDHNIGAWTRNLGANPQDFLSATNLALLYHARARLTADLADHQRALEAARTAIAIAPTRSSARALEASILFSLHDFRGALAAADALYREDPTQLGALATRADAALELGDLSAAARDLDTLAAVTSGPAIDVRLARYAFVTGDLGGALALARAARDTALADGADPSFYEYALAEYARLAGDATTARAGYEAALLMRATDLGALLGLARVRAFDGELDAAIVGLESAVAIAPTPEAEALLGDLFAMRANDVARTPAERAADLDAASAAHGVVRFTRTLSALAGSVYDRQLLLFDLDHGTATTATLDAARTALTTRRDAAGQDLVAWALHRLGRDREAWTASQAARSTGADDARTLFHAGAIAARLGDVAARDLLARALALGPALDPVERTEAGVILAGLSVPAAQPG